MKLGVITKPNEKGQIVIPKDIRVHLGLKFGSEIVFEVREKEVVIRPEQDAKRFVEEFTNNPKKLKKIDTRKTREYTKGKSMD